MCRFNQVLSLIRAAVVLTSVSVMALGTVGFSHTSSSLVTRATAQTISASHTHNERWGVATPPNSL